MLKDGLNEWLLAFVYLFEKFYFITQAIIRSELQNKLLCTWNQKVCIQCQLQRISCLMLGLVFIFHKVGVAGNSLKTTDCYKYVNDYLHNICTPFEPEGSFSPRTQKRRADSFWALFSIFSIFLVRNYSVWR